MSKSESRTVLLTLLFVMIAGVTVWVASKVMDYRKAHVTLMQLPCNSGFIQCPAFQYDLFGDGTVVYQNAYLKDAAITYRINSLDAIKAIRRIDTSSIRTQHWGGMAAMHSSSCLVLYEHSGGRVENGCGAFDIGEKDAISPALRPLVKVLMLDFGNPDYEPSLPNDIRASAFVPSPKYAVKPIFWKRYPPPPPSDKGSEL